MADSVKAYDNYAVNRWSSRPALSDHDVRRWSLGHLTVVNARPAELVEIAARAGYDAICPLVGLVDFEGVPVIPLLAGDPDTLAMKRAIKATGVAVNTADGFVLWDNTDMKRASAAVSLMAELGARNINALVFDSNVTRGFDHLCELAAMAQNAGIEVVLEFMPMSQIASLQDALRWIARTGSTHIGLMVDQLHLAQSGGTPADLAAIDPTLIRAAQLCDAPSGMDSATYQRVAIYERMAPGDGELPVSDFMAALPPGLTCTLEIPRRDEPDLTLRAARMIDAGRRVDGRSRR